MEPFRTKKGSKKGAMKHLGSALIIMLVTIASGIGGLYMFEAYVSYSDSAASDFWWQYPTQPIPISPQSVATLLHTTPFESMYADLDYNGLSPWETRGRVNESRIFHIRSNRFGFYTEFPVDNFPEKEKNEFRIILIGGSGAQGHGGSTNDHMMYSLLEKKIQKSFANTGVTVRVINLALAGHEARTLSSVLRAYGHKLKPDMILSYNGANDIAQLPTQYENLCSPYYARLLQATYVAPQWVNVLGKHFPALIYRYGLGGYIKRSFYVAEYRKQGAQACLRDLGVDTSRGRLKTAIYRDAVIPMFAAHFESIKRDFCGIPIMLAWQAVHEGERSLYDQWLTDFDPHTNPIALVSSLNTQEVRMRFYNPEKRTVHFFVSTPNAAKPGWDDLMRSSEIFNQEDGIATIANRLSLENGLTISGRSPRGFNINHNLPGRIIYYLALPADATSPPPTAETILKEGKSLKTGSISYNFDPSLLESKASPVQYFTIEGAESAAGLVFEAREYSDVQNAPPPKIYYALETTPMDQAKAVYMAYTEQELAEFRRQGGVYQQFYERNKAMLDHYMNPYWYFLNVDKIANAIDIKTVSDMTPTSIAVHLDDVGQEVVAGIIYDSLKPVVHKLIHEPNKPICLESIKSPR